MIRALILIAFAAGGFLLVQLGRYVLAQLERVRQLEWKRQILESCNRRKTGTPTNIRLTRALIGDGMPVSFRGDGNPSHDIPEGEYQTMDDRDREREGER
jgi:hypothetical protein